MSFCLSLGRLRKCSLSATSKCLRQVLTDCESLAESVGCKVLGFLKMHRQTSVERKLRVSAQDLKHKGIGMFEKGTDFWERLKS